MSNNSSSVDSNSVSHTDNVFTEIRSQFPILDQQVHGKPLVYLDSAATAQKPQCVIDAESEYYQSINAGVHRGAHELASRATVAFEDARAQIAQFVGASSEEGREEIVVTAGATAGLNLLATAFGNASLGRGGAAAQRFALHEGDEIVVTEAEHHSVLLPMQELAARTGATLRWIPVTDDGRIDVKAAAQVINARTKVVAFTYVTNVTGTITDVPALVKLAHQVGALVVLDVCQAAPHLALDMHALDVDFAAFSAHKMYGPTGVGFLYGKRELLEALPPAQFGGSMVELAWLDQPAQYMEPPARFEAGTQPVAQVVAAGVAAQWLQGIGMDAVAQHEHELTEHVLELQEIPGVKILGSLDTADRIGTVAFTVEGVHPHDVGQYIDAQGVAIRVGHHCAQPIHRHFGVFASNRVSLGVYNTHDDIERFLEAVRGVRKFFGA